MTSVPIRLDRLMMHCARMTPMTMPTLAGCEETAAVRLPVPELVSSKKAIPAERASGRTRDGARTRCAPRCTRG